jgi:hypothetical protein
MPLGAWPGWSPFAYPSWGMILGAPHGVPHGVNIAWGPPCHLRDDRWRHPTVLFKDFYDAPLAHFMHMVAMDGPHGIEIAVGGPLC